MTWDAYNRRKNIVRAIADIADTRLDGDDLYEEIAEARQVYPDRDELLLDLQMSWFQTLSGQIDSKLYVVAATPEDLVCEAWSDAAAMKPGLRAILDANADHPALAKALDKEAIALAVALGLPPGAYNAREAGARVREKAREQQVLAAQVPDTPSGLFARIREVFAA